MYTQVCVAVVHATGVHDRSVLRLRTWLRYVLCLCDKSSEIRLPFMQCMFWTERRGSVTYTAAITWSPFVNAAGFLQNWLSSEPILDVKFGAPSWRLTVTIVTNFGAGN